jgi:hypothetical protein
MTAHGESCVAAPQIATEGVPIPSPKYAYTLDKKTYKPGATVQIRFAAPIPSPEKSRAWITAATVGSPAESYGDWVFVDDGASTAALKAPDAPGVYELRLHTEYPTKATNLVHAVPFAVAAEDKPASGQTTPRAQQRFTAATSARAGANIDIKFPVAMVAESGEQFWITIVARDAADTAYDHYDYVPAGARTMSFPVPGKAGDYEIRLHANYPTKTYNLVHRQAIHITE